MVMIDDLMPFGSVDSYLLNLQPESELIERMRQYAKKNHVPVITKGLSGFLIFLLRQFKPKNILEIGSAIGMSAIIMAESTEEILSQITTVEINDKRLEKAKIFIAESSYVNRINLLQHDVREESFYHYLKSHCCKFDFIFIDAAKGQYSKILNQLDPFLSEGGLMMFADVFQHHWVIGLNYPRHRDKTAVRKLRFFLKEAVERTDYSATIVPIDDGVLVMSKKRRL